MTAFAIVHERGLKRFLCPATGAFLVKSDALCEAGGESYFFVHIFGGFSPANRPGCFL